jgi:hypothetical protein
MEDSTREFLEDLEATVPTHLSTLTGSLILAVRLGLEVNGFDELSIRAGPFTLLIQGRAETYYYTTLPDGHSVSLVTRSQVRAVLTGFLGGVQRKGWK